MKLTVRDLNKKYGKKKALKGVSFSLEPGIYGLLGPNGAGKSTLMNIMTGNLTPTSGSIHWNSRNITEMSDSYRELLGYVPQQQALYPDFTAVRFLSYIAALQGMKSKEAKARISSVLGFVELSDVSSKKIKTLSGGMKQRLLIAQSILADPKLLIMDEPTAGLDPKQRVLMRKLIKEISVNKIVIFATHVVSDIETISDEVLLLKDGSLIRKGSCETLTEEVRKAAVRPVQYAGQKITLEDVYLYHFGDQYDKTDLL